MKMWSLIKDQVTIRYGIVSGVDICIAPGFRRSKPVLNEPLPTVPETGVLTEITVPYAQAYRYTSFYGWQPIYRLYYGSTHWIIGIDPGPDGQPWYRIRDELLSSKGENYHAPAIQMRYIPPEEYSPLSTDIPATDKSIDVDLSMQTLTAYEGSTEVFKTRISSGLPNTSNGGKRIAPKRLEVILTFTPKHLQSIWVEDTSQMTWTPTFFQECRGFHSLKRQVSLSMEHGGTITLVFLCRMVALTCVHKKLNGSFDGALPFTLPIRLHQLVLVHRFMYSDPQRIP